MLRAPSSRREKKEVPKLNLIPILDAVFIFIFFLLMSANFIKIFEINSDVPIVSDAEPPKNKKVPLALTLSIQKNSISVMTGIPAKTIKTIKRNEEGKFDTEELHNFLIDLKKQHSDENTVIMEPKFDMEYQEIIEVMDSVRMMRPTDEALFIKNKDGIEEKVDKLFDNIVFGNIMS